MVNALDSGASCLGASPGWEHCVMFLGKTLYSLSIQVYKWVPANCWENQTNCGEVTYNGLASRPREVEILVAASCYRTGISPGSYMYEPVLALRLRYKNRL